MTDGFAWHHLPDGGAAVRWPAAGDASAGDLADAVAAWLAQNVRYAQVFLPGAAPADLLAAAGFRPLTVLEVMRRPVTPADADHPPPAGLALHPFDRLSPALVRSTLARTHAGSLDAPELDALRLDPAAVHPPDPAGLSLIAFRAREPVAALLLAGGAAGALEVSYLGVVPEARRAGVATRLVGFAVAQAALADCRAVTLSVDGRNAPAKALYGRHGFTVTGRHPVWWWVNERLR